MVAGSGTDVRQRLVQVLVRLSPEEDADITREAVRQGVTRQHLLRESALDAAAGVGPAPLVGIKEIGGIYGLTKQQAHSLTKRADFPEPQQRLGAGPVWQRSSVEAWAATVGYAPPASS